MLWTFSKRPEKTSVGWRPWDVPRTSISNLLCKCIFTALFSNLFHRICAWNTNIIVLGFLRNFLKTSYKDPKVTSGGWRSQDVPRTSMLNINTKHVFQVIFSVLVHQMCVLDAKKLIIVYSFSFGGTSYEHLKNVQKWHLQRDVLGTSI